MSLSVPVVQAGLVVMLLTGMGLVVAGIGVMQLEASPPDAPSAARSADPDADASGVGMPAPARVPDGCRRSDWSL